MLLPMAVIYVWFHLQYRIFFLFIEVVKSSALFSFSNNMEIESCYIASFLIPAFMVVVEKGEWGYDCPVNKSGKELPCFVSPSPSQ